MAKKLPEKKELKQEKVVAKDEAVASEAKQPEFGIRQIYIKNISFEAPNMLEILKENWKPEVGLDIQTKGGHIEGDIYEVVLRITATVKSNDKTAFIVEVDQAGLFALQGFASSQLGYMLGSYCPNILFPYVREVVADAVMRGGFPPLYLAPVNFDALYEEHMKKQQKEDKK